MAARGNRRPGRARDAAPSDEHPRPAWADLPAGPQLAAALDDLDPSILDDFDLVEFVAAADRVKSWAESRQYASIGIFARRRPVYDPHDQGIRIGPPEPQPDDDSVLVSEFAILEVGLALAISAGSARARIEQAVALTTRLPETLAALAAGHIDGVKARKIIDATEVLSSDAARAVEKAVLQRAGRQTPSQLGRSLRRQVLKADPKAAAARHRSKVKNRELRIYDDGDGVATLLAHGIPADAAIAVYNLLDRDARAAKATGGDSRTLAALRVDSMIARLLGHCPGHESGPGCSNCTDGPAPAPARRGNPGPEHDHPEHDHPEHDHPEQSLSGQPNLERTRTASHADSPRNDENVDWGTRPGEKFAESEGSNEQAATRGRVETSAPSRTPRTTDPSAGRPPGPRASGEGPAVAAPPPQRAARGAPKGTDPTPPCSRFAGCRSCGLASGLPDGATLVQVTVAATTLMGLDRKPGELAGFGPIPAEQALAIASDPSSVWYRLLTDPVSGTLLDYGTTRYRPPAPLARFVRARDGTCRMPICNIPAHRCDLDHAKAYPDGPTAEHNLGPRCRRDHRGKQQPGWHLEQDTETATFTWTTPSGHRYTCDPTVLHEPDEPEAIDESSRAADDSGDDWDSREYESACDSGMSQGSSWEDAVADAPLPPSAPPGETAPLDAAPPDEAAPLDEPPF